MAATTATWDMRSGIQQFGHRTNSLAFAKHDCHTCAALKKKCDRRRPCCGTCQSSQRQCGGFAMDLIWKKASVSKADGSSAGASCENGSHHGHSPPQESRSFRFVKGRPARRRKFSKIGSNGARPSTTNGVLFSKFKLNTNTPTTLTGVSPETVSATPIDNDLQRDDGLGMQWIPTGNTYTYGPPVEPNLTNYSGENYLDPDASTVISPRGHCLTPGNGISSQRSYLGDSHPNTPDSPGEQTAHVDNLEDIYEIPAAVTYRNLAHKYSEMFIMFNKEFCVVPLSTDCRHNPFRARADFVESFSFLLHGVLAISCHHLSKKNRCAVLRRETHNHWSTAVQQFSTALSHTDLLPLLDTILILINFESTQSAYGMLSMHLGGARKLLQQAGAVDKFAQSSRLRAQVAMLVWWDVTSSLISRRQTRLADPYLEMLQAYDENDGWSFLTLNGCPTEFVAAMARLAKLAEIYEKTTRMECTSFDTSHVDAVVQRTKEYVHDEGADDDCLGREQEDPDSRQNRAYCVEAWRHAILLYATRVFTPKLDAQGLRLIKHHSRAILDSARCIPPTEPFQKQLLLPVFLAGAEVGDDFNRSFARQYCEHWSNTSHFDQFRGVAAELEEIWRDWSPWTRDVYWWGLKVGCSEKNGEEHGQGKQGMNRELLLG